MDLPYDKKSPESIETYAKDLIDKSFQDVINQSIYNVSSVRESSFTYGNTSRKGGLGNLLEKYYFGYEPNSDSQADFPDAGVELKVSPYEIKKNGKISAGERLVLTMINFNQEVEPDFFNSHVWTKCKLMLLIYYLRDKTLASNLDYIIKYAQLFEFPEEDIAIILNDYKIIIDKILHGKAHELSESDTLYLGACTKGATAEKSLVSQKYNSDVLAKSRAFCLKTSYMTYILNNYIVPGKKTYRPSLVTSKELHNKDFATILQEKLSKYIDWYEDDIAESLDIEINKSNKSYEATLIYNMLGVKNTHIEEFDKAGIIVRIIKYRLNKSKNQQFRLDDINFMELDAEPFDADVFDEDGNAVGWESSKVYDLLGNTKYLFAVFWEDENGSIFKGSQLWGMPDNDLEIVRNAWSRTKNVVREGVKLQIEPFGKTVRVTNNLPGMSDNGIFHIRPHAEKSYYVFSDGRTFGAGGLSDSTQLPSGERITKQSYWLNRSYIDNQIDKSLKKEY